MGRIGLLAGEGMLPVIWAEAAQKHGREVVTIGLTPAVEAELLSKNSRCYYPLSVGQLQEIIDTLQAEKITEAVMMGKVHKIQLYQGLKLDQRLIQLLSKLKSKNDDAILLALVEEMAAEGICFVKQTSYMEEFIAIEGNMTPELDLNLELKTDMEYAFKIAKEIGRLDIGQTVVVKGGAVIAVEAIEGTDQAILRGGNLATGAVVAKVSKPQQDLRFDVPTIGLTTMGNLVTAGMKGLVVEADKTFFVQQTEILALAKKHGIVIVAMR